MSGLLTKGRQYAISRYFNYTSTNVFARDWDVLLLLDGCRVDALAELSGEYEFLGSDVGSITSVAGNSPKWLANTFRGRYRREIGETVYVSANPHTRRVLDTGRDGLYGEMNAADDWMTELADLVPVWEQAWDEERGTVPARQVTDSLIDAVRASGAGRYVAHYMQPHFPSVPHPLGSSMDLKDDARWNNDVWDRLARGELSRETVWESYLENLRYVLDEVELVLENIDSPDIVISADHGNAFGELGQYGHGPGFVRPIRVVPWVEVAGTDERTYEPEKRSESVDTSVEEQLSALGYR